jgi:peptidoglycan hydrolase-like protein with peptidoglycan-binding domain
MTVLALLVGPALCAAAGTPDVEALRNELDVLRAQIAALKVSTAAPLLPGQLSDFSALLGDLAASDPSRAEAARRLQTRVGGLQDAVRRQADSSRPARGFYLGAAEQVRSLVDDASALLGPPADAALPALPTAASAAAQSRLDAGLARARSRIQGRLAAAAGVSFDGGASARVVAASASAAAAAPELRRQSAPVYSPALAADQTALNAVRAAAGLRRIANDGLFGPGTQAAVKNFQGRCGLPPTGVIDAATASAILSEFQGLKGLPISGTLDAATERAVETASRSKAGTNPGHYFQGSASDFDETDARASLSGVLATVYTPFLAHSAGAKTREGGARDRFMQTICTLERYVAGRCPYVSVAIDMRLKVPDGTPLLIPEIDRIVGRTVQFRIVDTGSRRLFRGTGHVDIATDSTERFGYGSQISGRRMTLVLPQGLHPAQP